jgi:uncharacterized protein YkwD
MNRSKYLILILLMLTATAFATTKTISIAEFEQQVYQRTNYERRLHGLPDLAYDKGLADLARRHSQNMLAGNYFAHEDMEGLDVAGRKDKYYPALYVTSIGENLAYHMIGDKVFSPIDVVTGLMNSPPHRENILNPDYTYIGVGVVVKGDKLYTTQNFAQPLFKQLSPLPKKAKQTQTYTMEFEYMGIQDPAKLQAILKVPDPKTEVPIGGNLVQIGSEPRQILWLDAKRFRVNLDFKYGKGKYELRFGFDDSYYQDGFIFKVK